MGRSWILVALFTFGCRSGEKPREWKPEDHDQPGRAQGQVAAVSASPEQDAAELGRLAWRKHCLTCHGMDGLGDGPQGAMVNAPNLADGERTAKLTDEQIAETIRKGKNRMPGVDLPDKVVQGLVQRVRDKSFGR